MGDRPSADTPPNREVALKILPESFAADSQRAAFPPEARGHGAQSSEYRHGLRHGRIEVGYLQLNSSKAKHRRMSHDRSVSRGG